MANMANGSLDVFLHGKHVGAIVKTRGKARFSYDGDVAAALPGAPLLSCALPVTDEPFDAERTKRWFWGLLPEEGRFEALQRFFGIEDDGYLPVLEQVGWECAGAVQVMPPNDAGRAFGATSLAIDPRGLAERLRALPEHPFDTRQTLRVSLGGFQEKLCVRLEDSPALDGARVQLKDISLPVDGGPSTHLLKPEPARFVGMAQSEAWAMRVAREVTPTAAATLLDLDDAPATLVVERYDRTHANGTVRRIHQEDCAQALGLSPLAKYASVRNVTKSDPTYCGIAAQLVRYAENPLDELGNLFKQMTVNVALGNTDAHAKNYAFVHPTAATVCMAPLYDVVPAVDFIPQTRHMGLRIDGQISIDRIERAHMVREAASWGIPSRLAEQLLDDALYALEEGIEAATELYPQAARRHGAGARERITRLRRPLS